MRAARWYDGHGRGIQRTTTFLYGTLGIAFALGASMRVLGAQEQVGTGRRGGQKDELAIAVNDEGHRLGVTVARRDAFADQKAQVAGTAEDAAP